MRGDRTTDTSDVQKLRAPQNIGSRGPEDRSSRERQEQFAAGEQRAGEGRSFNSRPFFPGSVAVGNA